MCKESDIFQEHVIKDCAKTEKLRAKLKKELNDLEPTIKIKHFWILFSIGIIAKT